MMEIMEAGNLRYIAGEGTSLGTEKYRAFYREGDATLYCRNRKDDISLPGFHKVYAYDYFHDLIIREAMRDLTIYLDAHFSDTDYFRTEDFWCGAMRHAGRPVVPDAIVLSISLENRRVRYYRSSIPSECSGVDCYYDLETRQLFVTGPAGKTAPTLAEFFYGSALLKQILAQRRYEEGLDPAPYGELWRINEFLQDKRMIHGHFLGGNVMECYRRSNLHAGELLKVKDGKFTTHCYNFVGNPPESIGLPLELSHRNDRLCLNHEALLSLDVDLSEEQRGRLHRRSLVEDAVALMEQGKKYLFTEIRLWCESGTAYSFLTPAMGISKESLPQMPEVIPFFWSNCAEKKIGVTLHEISIGAGEETILPSRLHQAIKGFGPSLLSSLPGYTTGYESFSYSAEDLYEMYAKDADISPDTKTALIGSKIQSLITPGLAFSFCEVAVKLPRETKRAFMAGNITTVDEAAALSLLRRVRFRNPDTHDFAVTVQNALLGSGQSVSADEELMKLLEAYGGIECAEELGARITTAYLQVDADDIPLDDFKQRRLDRIDRYEQKAAGVFAASGDLIDRSHKMVEHIPPGQPILVGHHSEARHRRDLDRSWSTLGKGVQEYEKSQYYAGKAASAKTNHAISSDDPDALEELREKEAHLVEQQEHMKLVNKYYRKHGTCKDCPGITDDFAEKLNRDVETGYSWEKQPYPAWQLSNNSANIRRIRERIKELESHKENPIEGWEFEGGRVVANTEINRLQIFFDEIPEKEFRQSLKRRWSFNFSRANDNAWQRQLNRNAVWAAKGALAEFAKSGLQSA